MSKTNPSPVTPDGIKVFTAPPVPLRAHRARPAPAEGRTEAPAAPPTRR
jgi:hypothetical protein